MQSPPVVLVVEEHVELRNVLGVALENEGYEVVFATDEVAALAILRSRPVDLLVTDRPELTVGAVDNLGQMEVEFPDLRVVALEEMGHGPYIFFGPWETSGERRILRKPFRLGDLVAACRDALIVAEPVDAG